MNNGPDTLLDNQKLDIAGQDVTVSIKSAQWKIGDVEAKPVLNPSGFLCPDLVKVVCPSKYDASP